MSNSLDLRNITNEERVTFTTAVAQASGRTPNEELLRDWGDLFELDRTFIATEEGRIVANSAALTTGVVVPGGQVLPMAGITAVGVAPTHRRKGLLTQMMTTLHEQALERDEAIAGLASSESHIYGRFGYGIATRTTPYTIDTSGAPAARTYEPCGTLRLVDVDDSFDLVSSIRRKYEAHQVGEVIQSEGNIREALYNSPGSRSARGALELAIHRGSSGEDDGYIAFRRSGKLDEDGPPTGTLNVTEQAWTSDRVLADLWRFVLDLDLIKTVEASIGGAIDGPLGKTLAEPRQLKATGIMDVLWLAILDVPVALAARTYGASDGLVVAVPMSNGSTQTVELEGSPEGSTCKETTKTPDVTIPQRWLGPIYLGDQSPTALANLDLIEGEQDKIERLSRMFETSRLPYCGWEI